MQQLNFLDCEQCIHAAMESKSDTVLHFEIKDGYFFFLGYRGVLAKGAYLQSSRSLLLQSYVLWKPIWILSVTAT